MSIRWRNLLLMSPLALATACQTGPAEPDDAIVEETPFRQVQLSDDPMAWVEMDEALIEDRLLVAAEP